MITTGALIYGDRDRWLRLREWENPVALQLGGSNPSEMAKCAELAEEYKFNEVNINVGCPSDRVQAGVVGKTQTYTSRTLWRHETQTDDCASISA